MLCGPPGHGLRPRLLWLCPLLGLTTPRAAGLVDELGWNYFLPACLSLVYGTLCYTEVFNFDAIKCFMRSLIALNFCFLRRPSLQQLLSETGVWCLCPPI